jgi:hypothetical protein
MRAVLKHQQRLDRLLWSLWWLRDSSLKRLKEIPLRSWFLSKNAKGGALDAFVDHALTPQQQADANVKLFRWLMLTISQHTSIIDIWAISKVCCPRKFSLPSTRESFFPRIYQGHPSLIHSSIMLCPQSYSTIMDAEAARV